MRITIDGKLPKALGIDRRELKRQAAAFAAASSARIGRPFRDIAIILQDDAASDAAHRAIMNVAGATDVITQPFDPMPGEDDGIYGELYVNCDRALAAAPKRKDWRPAKELLLYIAHGMDHLSGADDHSPSDYAKMRRRELGWLAEAERSQDIAAVVVLSGGQDSATCLAIAVRKFGNDRIAAITFTYGQRHAIETAYAQRLAKRFGIAEHRVVDLSFYSSITSNALMTPGAKIELKPGAKCPTTVVEGRNAFFLLAAAVWAKSLNAKILYTGVSEADFSGYPDCRAEFIRAHQKSIRLALDYPIVIETPFMHLTKAEEWALADRLGIMDVIENETVTCYNGIPGKGCGKCPACKLRNRGLREYRSRRRA